MKQYSLRAGSDPFNPSSESIWGTGLINHNSFSDGSLVQDMYPPSFLLSLSSKVAQRPRGGNSPGAHVWLCWEPAGQSVVSVIFERIERWRDSETFGHAEAS